MNGSVSVRLVSPRKDPDTGAMPRETPPAVLGLLIYVDPANTTSVITINGGSTSEYRGTIYSPYGEVKINGTGDVFNVMVQLVADRVVISGTADVNF
ncbi:MAG: hypothetical protein R6W91_01405, partial [Thermoplasmata archaeon]